MAQLQVRPLGVGEIIDASVTIYRERFGSMISIALLLVFVPFVVSLIGGCTLDEVTGAPICTSPIGWLGSIASWVGNLVAIAAATLVAAEAYADIPSDWKRSAMAGLRNIVAIVVAAAVVGVAVTAGFIALIIPGIFLLVSFAVYTQALMLEDFGPIQSMRRSWRLASGERWHLLGAGLALTIITIIVLGIIGGALYGVFAGLASLDPGDARNIAQQIATLLSIPLSAAVGTVLYVDLRARKEGFEAEELATLLLSRRA